MATDIQGIAQLLEGSLDPKQNKQAETALREVEQTPSYALALLRIVASTSYPVTTRLASALYFKNFIRRNWTDESGNYKIPENEVVGIKKEIIGLMIAVPPAIQYQLGEAVSVIADSDFWQRWDTLVDDLVSRLSADDPIVNNGVLRVAHSIFKRWRPLFQSDELYTEINHVLEKFSAPFLTLVQSVDQAISQNENKPEVLQQWMSTLILIMKLFYDLSTHDMPPLFEQNLQAITSFWHKYLTYDNTALHTQDDTESGQLEYLKAGIFEVLLLYARKYEDDIKSHLGPFVASSWSLLTSVGLETKYDILVSKALHFLTAVVSIREHAESFNNLDVLGQVIEKVIIPNVALRDYDLELFKDEPIEFIRRDLEGSDSETRRRAATDLLRRLAEKYEQTVTGVVMRYVDHFLAKYAKDRGAEWKSKDTAVYLFSSIAVKGTVTTAHGATSTSDLVNVVDFFQNNIAVDLVADDVQPVLKVDAIKYLYTFRSQLTKQQWQEVLPLLVKHLTSPHYVVYTYAAIALERVLSITNDTQEPLIPKTDVVSLSKDLLRYLFYLIQKDSVPQKLQENEFLMKCVMRVLIIIRDGVLPLSDMVLTNFINITRVIRHNPSNPRFYYYHFEALGALIRFVAPSRSDYMETTLYPPFAEILQEDVQEFMPYVLQLFAALLEANPSGLLPDYYKSLVPPILMPTLWESKGNVPALVRLLTSIIPRGAEDLAKNNQLEPILGIFQKLVSSKLHESHGFDLIETVIASFPVTSLDRYFNPMLQILFARLSNVKTRTENFGIRFSKLYHYIAARDDKGLGADFFINVADQVQNGVFAPIYTSHVLPDTQKFTRPYDRKTAVVSLTKTLADSVNFVDRYKKGWTYTCEALLTLLLNPPVPTTGDEIIVDQDVDDMGFGVGFTQLVTCRKLPRDPFPDIMDTRNWVGEYLKRADERHNGRITRFIAERLSDEARQALIAYMN